LASLVVPQSQNSQQVQSPQAFTSNLEKQLADARQAQIDLIFSKEELKGKV
jgi:hypothetical protein